MILKISLLLPWLAALGGCVSVLPLAVNSKRAPSQIEKADQALGSMRCDEMFSWFNDDQPSTVEEGLVAIAKRRPQYLHSARFQYRSENSNRDASWSHPRVSLSGADAHTILSFSGRPGRPGFETLDAICFDPKLWQFSKFAVRFPGEAPNAEAMRDLSESDRKAKFVVQPLVINAVFVFVDAFDFWPGYYGAVADALYDPHRPGTRPLYETIEEDNWGRFSAEVAKKGRYAHVQLGSARPNAEFLQKVSWLNGKRIVADLDKLGPAFHEKKWEFANALYCAPRGTKQLFVQHEGDSQAEATFRVLPQESDEATLKIFLSQNQDYLRREKQTVEILHAFNLGSPVPRETFAGLRAYYRELLNQPNLEVESRLSAINVDEVLLVRELARVLEPFGVDPGRWSLSASGAPIFANGLGGDGQLALREMLDLPFRQRFFANPKEGLPTVLNGGSTVGLCGTIATHLTAPLSNEDPAER